MGQELDDLAKALATGISRREALRRFGTAVIGGAVATLLPWHSAPAEAQTTDACVDQCRSILPKGQSDSCVRLCGDALRACTTFCFSRPRLSGRRTCLENVRACPKSCRVVTGGINGKPSPIVINGTINGGINGTVNGGPGRKHVVCIA